MNITGGRVAVIVTILVYCVITLVIDLATGTNDKIQYQYTDSVTMPQSAITIALEEIPWSKR